MTGALQTFSQRSPTQWRADMKSKFTSYQFFLRKSGMIENMYSYKNDTLGFETLYQKQQYEVDIVDLQDEDPLAELHHQFQQMGFAAIPFSAGGNGSQAPSAKRNGKKGDKQRKSHRSTAKGEIIFSKPLAGL
jgi:hypothetical protein